MLLTKNIVIVTAAYPPEPVVSARMAHDLAVHLVTLGHDVVVVCPQPSRPIGADYSHFIRKGKVFEATEDLINVVRLPSYSSPVSSIMTRLRESCSFGRHVCKYLSNRKDLKPDVFYVNAWPLFAQAYIMRYAYKNKIPVILQIMDVYPESLANKFSQLFKNIMLPFKWFDAWIARQAKSVVVISETMRQTYIKERRVPAERVVTIPTWQDEGNFIGDINRNEACQCYGIPENLFTFLYLGNIGPVAGVDFLIRSFYHANIQDAQLLIIGGGSEKFNCENLVNKLKAQNIKFISDPNANNVPILQSMAHVCMLTLKRGVGNSSIPSKLPAYMFSAKPIIATVDSDSDTAQIIKLADCGWVGDFGNINWLANKMIEVSLLSPSELQKCGGNGREFGLMRFSKSNGVGSLSELLVSI